MEKICGKSPEQFEHEIKSRFLGISEPPPSVSFREELRHKDLQKQNKTLYDELFNGRESRHCFMSEDGKYIYHLGIIDYLQDFNIDKYLENKLKSMLDDGSLISAVPPEAYSYRFFNFMQRHVIINQEISESQKTDISYKRIASKKRTSHYHKMN